MGSESFGRSGSSQTGTHDSATPQRSTGGAPVGPTSGGSGNICAFWIGSRCFGLDTALVGEVVSVEDRIPIPLAPPAVRGVFNLRGEPLPLLSLADVLGVGREASSSGTVTAMVLRQGDLAAGLWIDRVQAILALDPRTLAPPTNTAEDVAVLGFLEVVTDKGTTIVSVLDPGVLLEKLNELRFLREATA